ncbi:MAG TPA: substrate-binding domain-containing protein [Streptosporangiaceae bacterium]|nr:substrate-binding domain-containing protein [Streptosporangiaceae bacterium]
MLKITPKPGAAAVPLLVALGLAVAACSSSTTGGSSTASGTSTSSHSSTAGGSGTGAKKLSSLLFVNPLPNYPQWKLIGQCMSAEAKTLGVPYTETGPTGVLNPVQMVQEISTGIANKTGAIVTFPASPAFGPVLQQAHQAGIITGTMYGGGGTATADFNAGVDWNALGRQYVAALAGRPGVQRVGLLAVSPTGVGKAFIDGFKLAAQGNKNIKVEAIIYTNDDPATTLSETNALLLAHPDINVLASHMGTSTTPVVSAIKAKGDIGKVVLLGNGANGGGSQGAQQGIVYRFLLQDLCTMGHDTVSTAADIAAGKPASKSIVIGTVMAGLNNYQSYLAKGWM